MTKLTGVAVLPGFEVAPDELQAAAAQLQHIGADARSDLALLVSEAQSLLDGGWHGPAAIAFERGWAQWLAGAGEMLDGLDAMARLLGVTGRGYRCAEEGSMLRGVL